MPSYIGVGRPCGGPDNRLVLIGLSWLNGRIEIPRPNNCQSEQLSVHVPHETPHGSMRIMEKLYTLLPQIPKIPRDEGNQRVVRSYTECAYTQILGRLWLPCSIGKDREHIQIQPSIASRRCNS